MRMRTKFKTSRMGTLQAFCTPELQFTRNVHKTLAMSEFGMFSRSVGTSFVFFFWKIKECFGCALNPNMVLFRTPEKKAFFLPTANTDV